MTGKFKTDVLDCNEMYILHHVQTEL